MKNFNITIIIGLITVLIALIVVSCGRSAKTNENSSNLAKDTILQTDYNLLDTITELFNKALISDTIEFGDFMSKDLDILSFLFFKSGNIISKTEKNAIVVTCPKEESYKLKLYSVQNEKWELTDSINLDDVHIVFFDMIFDDYNFDGQKDIYVQTSSSNGYSISHGHLIIINPKTKKFELCKEVREFGNMKIDPKTKTIKSEEVHLNDYGERYVTIFTHKWENGKFKTISKKNAAITY